MNLSPLRSRRYGYMPAVVSASLLILFSATLPLLRPVADDYCSGMLVHSRGLIGALFSWYNGHSAYLVPNFLNALLVGLPLALLSDSFASSITLVSAICVTGFVGASMLSRGRGGPNLALIVMTSSAWAASLASSVLRSHDSLTQSFIHWQVINAAYILPSALMLWLFLCFFRLDSHSASYPQKLNRAAFFIGLTGGLTSVVVALFLASTFFALRFCSRWLPSQVKLNFVRDANKSFSSWVFFTGLSAGFLFAHLNPGTFQRIASTSGPVLGGGSAFLSTVIKGPIKEYLYNLVGPMMVTSLACGIIIGVWYAPKVLPIDRLFGLSLWLLAASLILEIHSGFVEYFTYDAHWHMAYSFYLTWFALLSFGCCIGTWFAAVMAQTFILDVASVTMLFAFVLFMIFVSSEFDSAVRARLLAWEVGAAPVAGAADIETEWVRSCAMTLTPGHNRLSAITQ